MELVYECATSGCPLQVCRVHGLTNFISMRMCWLFPLAEKSMLNMPSGNYHLLPHEKCIFKNMYLTHII